MAVIVKTKLADQVAAALLEKISCGEYPLGKKIPTEPDLMRLFGVGRSTVREAVRILASGGRLDVRQGDGMYVSEPAAGETTLAEKLRRTSIREVYEVRKLLEIFAARQAAKYRTEADLALMRDALDRREAAAEKKDFRTYVDSDIDFHAAVANACGNRALAAVFEDFTDVLRSALDSFVADGKLYQNRMDLHRAMYYAIKTRDANEAERYARKNIDLTLRSIRELEK